MNEREIEISYQLEVLPGGKIIVPGCEPASAISSKLLAAAIHCNNSMVDLDLALEAIPGSYVKYGANFGRPQLRQRWFVLPPFDQLCPCSSITDYYDILRNIATDDTPVEERFDQCDLIGMGFCPSPDFELTEPPLDSPYIDEGAGNVAQGVLPPVPPWNQ